MKKNVKGLLITMMVLILMPSTAWALGTEAIRAPLNPEFVDYQKNLEPGIRTTEREESFGLIPPPLKQSTERIETNAGEEIALPEHFDLRTTGIVPPIRDQRPHGSCWAFASYASLESHLAKEGAMVDLSENNLIRNHGFDLEFDAGGNANMTTAYLGRWDGPILESNDPYDSPQKIGLPPIYHSQNVEFLPESYNTIKQVLMEEGIILLNICYDGNYYNEEHSAFYYNGDSLINHSVSIVGWDDHFSKENFGITPADDGAWIIRNSWGSEWGEDGYFYLSYNDTHACSDVVSFNNAEKTDNYKRIYDYDPLGLTSGLGYPYADTIWGANIFKAKENENLRAISTYAISGDTDLTIEIYTDVEEDKPDSGNLRLKQSEFFENAGYYTIKLDELIPLVKDEKFSVVIQYNSSDSETPLPLEAPLENYSSKASSNPQESFIRNIKQHDWVDISEKSDDNICIKAFTGGTNLVPGTTYRTHVQNDGWQTWKNNGAMSGTEGQGLRLEGIELKTDTPDYHLGLAYKTHIENLGWEENYKYDGQMSGTEGLGYRLEAIQIELTGRDAKKFDLYYRVHAENFGWLDWAKNNDQAGTAGFAYRLEGIEIKMVEKGASPPGETGRAFVEKKD